MKTEQRQTHRWRQNRDRHTDGDKTETDAQMATKQRQTHIFRLNKDRHIDEDRTRNKFMDVEKSEAKIERTCALIMH